MRLLSTNYNTWYFNVCQTSQASVQGVIYSYSILGVYGGEKMPQDENFLSGPRNYTKARKNESGRWWVALAGWSKYHHP